MKGIKIVLLVIAVIILLVNLPPIRWFNYFYGEDYNYINYNGEYYCGEYGGKGSSFEGCKNKFNYYLEKHPEDVDQTIYRTFSIKPWQFWEWFQYVGKDRGRFRLPYISVETVQRNRIKENKPPLKD
jgi:hypothetical protein